MAANKRKILENARKLAQKGAKDKALSEYQKLLKLDPKDSKLRLEIGDAYRRWGQVDEAIDTYSKVASQYMKEGFDARAVAVYKQILNLDPDRYDSYPPLAELYERMGLATEAIQALQTAADGYHKQGKKPEALELLRKMANVDPTNTTSRMKVADLLRQEGMAAEAVAEYGQVAAELERQGDVESVGNVYRRLLELDAGNIEALSSLAQNLIRRGKAVEAVPLAERALQLDDGEPERYSLVVDAYERTGRDADVPDVYRRLADVYRQRGDEEKARDILQRHAPVSDFSAPAEELSDASDELGRDVFIDSDDLEGSEDLFEEELLEEGATISGAELPIAEMSETVAAPGESLVDEEDVQLEEPVAATDSASAPEPAGAVDVEQLLAEASVYLRYGKRDKAVAHLEAVLEVEPSHRVAIEKLGEAFADGGENERAVELWLRAAKRAQLEEDADAVAVLRGRIAALDESAAESLDPSKPEPTPPTDDPEPKLVEVEIDLGLDAAEDAAEEEGNEPGGDIEIEIEEPAVDEIEIDELDLSGVEEDLVLESAEADDHGAEGEADDRPPDVLESEDENGVSMSVADVADVSIDNASLSSATTQQILDDLEEADFYVQQELFDEAEEIYQRVLTVAPNHPRALVRLGEVAAARGESPAGSVPAVDPATVESTDEPLVAEGDDAMSSELEFAIEPSGIDAVDQEITVDEECAGPSQEDLEGLSDLDIDDEEAPTAEATDGVEESDTEELTPHVDASAEPEPAADDGGDFDLAAALSDAFDDDPNATSGNSGMAADAGGFEAVFDAFKKGVSETLTDSDFEAHYDLAIAYKEMGLHDDAMNEFRMAMGNGERRVECLHLIGVCALDAGQASIAAAHLEELLEIPDLNREQSVAGNYDLGRARESLGDVAMARSAYEAVAAALPDFCDVQERLAGLGEPSAPEPEGGGFESFDDLVAEAGLDEDDASQESSEAIDDPGECFDDLVTEANADDAPEDVVAPDVPASDASGPELVTEVELVATVEPEAQPEAEPEPEPELEPEPEPEAIAMPDPPQPAKPAAVRKRGGRRKKKKISFV